MEENVRAELPGQPVSVGHARSLVRHALREWDLEPLQDTVLLLVSELATNAVLHARSDFTVEASRTTEGVRVWVSDRSPRPPAQRHHGPTSGTGRGLDMVASMSSAWGTGAAERPYTKAVWFEVSAA